NLIPVNVVAEPRDASLADQAQALIGRCVRADAGDEFIRRRAGSERPESGDCCNNAKPTQNLTKKCLTQSRKGAKEGMAHRALTRITLAPLRLCVRQMRQNEKA